MARKKGGSGGANKGKKEHKNKPSSKKYKFYSIEGDSIKRKAKNCPRCGPGVFLSSGGGRTYCGKCHFTEFAEKKQAA